MKLTFLGTSHGVPSADRHCTCMMLQVGGKVYFIDAGAPMIEGMLKRNIKITDFKAFFNTHSHGDHLSCLHSAMSLCNWYYKDTAITYFFTEEQTKQVYTNLITITDGGFDLERSKLKVASAGLVYEDENVKVTYFPTKHMAHINRPSYSVLVEAEGKKVFFSGDLRVHLWDNDFPQYVKDNEVDVFVCEMAHFGANEALPHFLQTKAKALYINHIYNRFDEAKALNGKLPYPVFVPDDNDEVEI